MTTASEYQAKLTKSVTNMDRFDGIINGANTSTVATDNGIVPTVAKAIKDFQDEADATIGDLGDVAGAVEATAADRVQTGLDRVATGQDRVAVEGAAVAVEGAAAAAVAVGNLKPDTATGLSETSDGEFFSVPAENATDFLVLYQNQAGSAVEIDRYPNKAAVDSKVTAVETLGALKALPLAQVAHYDGADFTFLTGDYTGKDDDTNIIKSDYVDLSEGAWERQGADKISFTQLASNAASSVGAKLRQFLNAADAPFGVVGGGGDESAAFQQAVNAAVGAGKRKLRLCAGTYTLDNIELPSEFRFEAEVPHATTIKHKAGTGNPLFRIAGGPCVVCSFGGVTLQGNPDEDGIGILIDAAPSAAPPFHGGLWWAYIHDLEVRDFGRKGIWVRGGNTRNADPYDFKTPNQFIQFSRVHVYRPATANSRCLSVTGQVGQVSFDGECEFDGKYIDPAGRLGANVCIGREFVNATTGEVGDLVDASEETTGAYPATYSANTFTFKSGWAARDSLSPALIKWSATSQNSRYGLVIDYGAMIGVEHCWFENTDRAATVIASSTAVSFDQVRFTNAGGKNSNGYCLKIENSAASYSDCEFKGDFDKATVQMNGALHDKGGNVVVSGNAEGQSIGSFKQLSIAAGVLDVSSYDRVFVTPGGTLGNPTVLTTITSRMPAGARLLVNVSGGWLVAGGGGNIKPQGYALFGPGDTFELVRGDGVVGEWVLIGRAPVEGRPGVAYAADGNLIVQPNFSKTTEILDTPLTADRTVTINGGTEGNRFRFVRTAAATGANWTIVNVSLNLAPGEGCEVEHDGAKWVVVARGSGL